MKKSLLVKISGVGILICLLCVSLSYIRQEGYRKRGIILSLNQEEKKELDKRVERLNALGENKAADILQYAIDALGKKYSQKKRNKKGFYDCSSLAYYACMKAGEDIGIDNIYVASTEAKWCEMYGMMISFTNMQEGDLIFYSFSENLRHKNIDHVAIYAGGGKVIDASMSIGYVVYRDLYSIDNIVVIGRLPQK